MPWLRTAGPERCFTPAFGITRSWAVLAFCTKHTDSVGFQLQGMCLSVLKSERIDHFLCRDPSPPNH